MVWTSAVIALVYEDNGPGLGPLASQGLPIVGGAQKAVQYHQRGGVGVWRGRGQDAVKKNHVSRGDEGPLCIDLLHFEGPSKGRRRSKHDQWTLLPMAEQRVRNEPDFQGSNRGQH